MFPSYSSLPAALGFQPPKSSTIDRTGLLALLGKLPSLPDDLNVRIGSSVEHDGLDITTLSWDVGFGPRTEVID